MKLICDIGQTGIRILRCFSYDGQVELPGQIQGQEVTELGAYAFAETVRRIESGVKYLAELREDGQTAESSSWEWKECPQEWLEREMLDDKTPAVIGNRLTAVSLPGNLKKIGAYAFYLCEKLERVALFSSTTDLGAGLFTGCYGVNLLEIWMVPGKKSCLKEVLAELRQTLRVNCRGENGEISAKLLFPEYFEESVENTPARILTQEMHGCGHRYRNAFSGTQMQYGVYDKLFAHIQVQESSALVMELVLGRLMYPVQLGQERQKIYEEYAVGHGREAVQIAIISGDMDILRFMGQAKWCTKTCMEEMLSEAGDQENAQATGLLMELRRRQERESGKSGVDCMQNRKEQRKRRRFEL